MFWEIKLKKTWLTYRYSLRVSHFAISHHFNIMMLLPGILCRTSCFVELLSGLSVNFCEKLADSAAGIQGMLSKIELQYHLEITTEVSLHLLNCMIYIVFRVVLCLAVRIVTDHIISISSGMNLLCSYCSSGIMFGSITAGDAHCWCCHAYSSE